MHKKSVLMKNWCNYVRDVSLPFDMMVEIATRARAPSIRFERAGHLKLSYRTAG